MFRNHLRGKRETKSRSYFISTACTVGLLNCKDNEFCKTKNNRSRSGICECKDGFKRREDGICVESQSIDTTYTPLSTLFIQNDKIADFTNFANSSNRSSTILKTTGIYVPTTEFSFNQDSEITNGPIEGTSTEPLKKLVVNINNKTVTLPEGATQYKDWVTLSAYALGGNLFSFSM